MRFQEFEEEWNRISVLDIGKIRMCKRIFKSDTTNDGEIPFYKIGTVGKTPNSYISRELFEEYRSKFNYPNKGDIFITCSGTIGNLVVFDGDDSYYQDSNIVWIEHGNNDIDNRFLYYLLLNTKWNHLSGSTITRLYNSDLYSIKFDYPSLIEQNKVSSSIEMVDRKIELLDKKLENLKLFKKGLFNNLYNDLICIKKTKLKDIIKLTSGFAFQSKTYSNDGLYKVITISNVKNNSFDLTTVKRINKTPMNINSEQMLKIGDFLISMTGNVGRVCKVTQDNCLLNQRVCKIETKKVNKDYIFQVLLSNYFRIRMESLAEGAAQANLKNKDILDYKIKLPYDEVQYEISNSLNLIDKKIINLVLEVQTLKQFNVLCFLILQYNIFILQTEVYI